MDFFFDRMKLWPENPFDEYQCTKGSSYFTISKKHKKVNYAVESCRACSNKNCSHMMCKLCCLNYLLASDKVPACKTRDHKNIQLPSNGDDGVMEDEVNNG